MSGVRFTLLGRLMLAGGAGDPVALSGARQRALLASLLLSANVPVSPDALAEAVWDGSPPPGAPATLRSHIKRLRRALGPQAGARITACDPGYLISVQEPELDVLLFETACRNAGTARRASRWQEASAAATRALELWRGTPLLDVPSQVLRDQFVPRLEQMRLQALEDRAEADLRLGRQDRLIPELRELAGRHPVRERFHAQLMEALARGGWRQRRWTPTGGPGGRWWMSSGSSPARTCGSCTSRSWTAILRSPHRRPATTARRRHPRQQRTQPAPQRGCHGSCPARRRISPAGKTSWRCWPGCWTGR